MQTSGIAIPVMPQVLLDLQVEIVPVLDNKIQSHAAHVILNSGFELT